MESLDVKPDNTVLIPVYFEIPVTTRIHELFAALAPVPYAYAADWPLKGNLEDVIEIMKEKNGPVKVRSFAPVHRSNEES